MARRVEEIQSAALPWLVAVEGDETVGYAYGHQWRSRSGYRHSAEITAYVAPNSGGHGVGTRLYASLFPILASLHFHAVVGGIALPNPASIALHEKFGMRKVAHFPQVGWKFERWIDVGYWHRTL
jgi:phosphinothricin acetyltransferase